MKPLIAPLYHYINKRTKLFTNVHDLTKKCRMLCSKHDVLGSKIIGLDSINKKLLYLQLNRNKSTCIEINLKDLDSCTVKKQYQSIQAGGLEKMQLHEYLKTISLELHFKNGRPSIGIPFYEKKKDKIRYIQELEAKTKIWQTTVSKLLPLYVNQGAWNTAKT